MNAQPRAVAAPQIRTRAEAERLLTDLVAAMDDLLAILAEETALVRAGRLAEARDLAELKGDRAATYTRLMLVARDEVAALSRVLPEETEALKRRHELFRAEVQINLAVLATARDVAEDLMRSVANDVGATAAPAGYGQAGRPAATAGMRGFVRDRTL